ncbi:GNAT family N-acetyltransferase [Flavobacterium sp. GT3R68]|uniref:GNAT family N-acetyltransferase n=1 Tax=Flavobacterium sp. GT3R68 TaxID=2594437 RepID=UPI000F8694F4|nr:GNAT family N-acetyltransferase [Flavobacterium sp. GT3R68]RTY87536.1 GNAT family N-acetyltransferase [Flavobacterium sp. GSN2]TRW90447.1 GNAT family N-acetyltransferase [Flavobacterium sp. GT3R68]
MQIIKEIAASETFSVRHPVLRQGKPIESCRFDNDELPTTHHFGLFINHNLVGAISVFEKRHPLFTDERQFQIRGMAVLEDQQKKGLGESLMKYAEESVKTRNGKLIWFNARITAVGFYQKLGYEITGEAFEITDVGTHYVLFKRMQ